MPQGFFKKTMVFLGLDDDELDEYDAGYPEQDVAVQPQPPRRFAPEPAVEAMPAPQPSAVRPLPRDPGGDPTGGTVLPSPRRTVVAMPKPAVHVVAPVRFSDAQEIADRFKSKQPVIVNLQVRPDGDGGIDRALARRMIDFCSGVTYALSGSMDRVAEQVFLLTPSEVEVSAEEKRRLKDQGLYAPPR